MWKGTVCRSVVDRRRGRLLAKGKGRIYGMGRYQDFVIMRRVSRRVSQPSFACLSPGLTSSCLFSFVVPDPACGLLRSRVSAGLGGQVSASSQKTDARVQSSVSGGIALAINREKKVVTLFHNQSCRKGEHRAIISLQVQSSFGS